MNMRAYPVLAPLDLRDRDNKPKEPCVRPIEFLVDWEGRNGPIKVCRHHYQQVKRAAEAAEVTHRVQQVKAHGKCAEKGA